MTNKKLNKKELIQVLVDNYGYENEDIKLLTNAKLEGLIRQEEKDAKELEESETLEQFTEDVLEVKDEDMVQVMSGIHGELIHRSQKSGRMWKFSKFGQIDRMPFIELMTIYNNNPKTLEECFIVILNDKVAKNFNLSEIYKNIVSPNNLDELFKKDVKDLESIVENLPESFKTVFVIRAKELYEQGKLDSMSLINFIQNKFDISLEDNAPLSNIV